MQKDLQSLKFRFIITVVGIVTIILGLILGALCYIINIGLARIEIDPATINLVMEGIIFRAGLIFIIGIGFFTIIANIASYWVISPIETALNDQKRFISDASHELKTPLTVITTNAELLQLDDLSAEDKKKFSDNILSVGSDMQNLIESMLDLVRMEKGSEAGFTDVNFSNLLSYLLLQFEANFFESNLNLIENIDKDIIIYASERQLGHLFAILIDNALKYSIEGDFTVDLHVVKNNVVLTVSNKADFFSERQLVDIFKRFYRVDESHSTKGSYGLGLPIAKRICEAYKGSIKAEYEGGRLYFIITLPLKEKK